MEMSRQLEISLSLERCIGESLVVFKATGPGRVPDKKGAAAGPLAHQAQGARCRGKATQETGEK